MINDILEFKRLFYINLIQHLLLCQMRKSSYTIILLFIKKKIICLYIKYNEDVRCICLLIYGNNLLQLNQFNIYIYLVHFKLVNSNIVKLQRAKLMKKYD